jgi:hypothetical protein
MLFSLFDSSDQLEPRASDFRIKTQRFEILPMLRAEIEEMPGWVSLVPPHPFPNHNCGLVAYLRPVHHPLTVIRYRRYGVTIVALDGVTP